jgi:hypothetical protein
MYPCDALHTWQRAVTRERMVRRVRIVERVALDYVGRGGYATPLPDKAEAVAVDNTRVTRLAIRQNE